jgi:hypothetical protein
MYLVAEFGFQNVIFMPLNQSNRCKIMDTMSHSNGHTNGRDKKCSIHKNNTVKPALVTTSIKQ